LTERYQTGSISARLLKLTSLRGFRCLGDALLLGWSFGGDESCREKEWNAADRAPYNIAGLMEGQG